MNDDESTNNERTAAVLRAAIDEGIIEQDDGVLYAVDHVSAQHFRAGGSTLATTASVVT